MKQFKTILIIPILAMNFCINFDRNKQIDINLYKKSTKKQIVFIHPDSFMMYDCSISDHDLNYRFFETARLNYIKHFSNFLENQSFILSDSDLNSDLNLKLSIYQCELPPTGYVGLTTKNKYKDLNTILTIGFLGFIPTIHYEPTGTYLTLEIIENSKKIQKNFSIQLNGSGLVSIFYLPHYIFIGHSSIREERIHFYFDSLIYIIKNRHRINI